MEMVRQNLIIGLGLYRTASVSQIQTAVCLLVTFAQALENKPANNMLWTFSVHPDPLSK